MDFGFIVFLIFFIFQCCDFTKADAWNTNHAIREKLLKKYDKFTLPHHDVNGTTTVLFNLNVKRISLDDDTQIFTVYCWALMNWRDDRLKWDYKDYESVTLVHFGDGELWKPDIHLYNNAEGSSVDHYENVHFLVFNNGEVLWVPPATLKVPCAVNLKFWPFDTQECKLFLGSWTTHGWQINLEFLRNRSEISASEMLVEKSDKWNIIKTEKKRHVTYYSGFREPYILLEFIFTIQRNSATFGAFVVIPAVVFPLFLMIQFILPVDHPKRLTIGFVSSILVVMELLFLKYSIPRIGSSAPLVVTYFSQCLIVVILTVFLSAILGRLSHPTLPLLDFPPPEIIKMILTGPLAVVLCVSAHASKVGLSGKSSEDGEVLAEGKSPSFSHEWLLVAKVVDRLSLILITCIFIFSLIGYIAPIK